VPFVDQGALIPGQTETVGYSPARLGSCMHHRLRAQSVNVRADGPVHSLLRRSALAVDHAFTFDGKDECCPTLSVRICAGLLHYL
jgi:hypothetical protein